MNYLTEFKRLTRTGKAPLFEGVDAAFVSQFKKMRARGQSMSVADWSETMRQALLANDPESDLTYNKFDLARVTKALRKIPDISVAPAREYSPALYAAGPQESLNKLYKMAKRLGADEVDFQDDGTLRLWWD